jgi:hypothetical protein
MLLVRLLLIGIKLRRLSLKLLLLVIIICTSKITCLSKVILLLLTIEVSIILLIVSLPSITSYPIIGCLQIIIFMLLLLSWIKCKSTRLLLVDCFSIILLIVVC